MCLRSTSTFECFVSRVRRVISRTNCTCAHTLFFATDYLKNFIRTGVAKIIGRPRDLIAMCKDGSLLPIKLAISEQVSAMHCIQPDALHAACVSSVSSAL